MNTPDASCVRKPERIKPAGDKVEREIHPACGYNMTGLYETRCPECGSQFTLEQLLAGQHRETLADTDRNIAS